MSKVSGSSQRAGRDCGAFSRSFYRKQLAARGSSWKMHLLFTLRVLFFRTGWSKVRSVNRREDRSLKCIDERKKPRRVYVRANASAVQSRSANAEKRRAGKDRFSQCQHSRSPRVPERIEDAPAQPPQAALPIVAKGGGKRARKGLRSTPRRSHPNLKF